MRGYSTVIANTLQFGAIVRMLCVYRKNIVAYIFQLVSFHDGFVRFGRFAIGGIKNDDEPFFFCMCVNLYEEEKTMANSNLCNISFRSSILCLFLLLIETMCLAKSQSIQIEIFFSLQLHSFIYMMMVFVNCARRKNMQTQMKFGSVFFSLSFATNTKCCENVVFRERRKKKK